MAAQIRVADKADEIGAPTDLLAGPDIEGGVVCADAPHTRSGTVTHLVQERKAHYLFPTKADQPTALPHCPNVSPRRATVARWRGAPVDRSRTLHLTEGRCWTREVGTPIQVGAYPQALDLGHGWSTRPPDLFELA